MASNPENTATRDEALDKIVAINMPDDTIPQSDLDTISGGRQPVAGHGHLSGGSA